ncbi:MAG: type I 3-dehydroquinate dehydratase, partial [Pyrobaculum sp.]
MPVRRPRDVEKALEAAVSCLELRLDYLSTSLYEIKPYLEEAVAEKIVIFTVRRAEEGGMWRRSEEERVELYQKLLELGPHYVDVEAESPIARQIADMKGSARLIASRHDFEKTPPLYILKNWADKAAEVGDIVKIVTYAKEPRDGLTILSLIGEVEKPTV